MEPRLPARAGEAIVALRRAAEQDRLIVGKLVDDLLEDSKKLLMMPFATLSALLSKVVRDLCRDQGKEAELVDPRRRSGDRQTYPRGDEGSADPSAAQRIDHGIEIPEAPPPGKPARATITLTVAPGEWQPGEHHSFSDDGAGIDLEKSRQRP